MKKTILTTLLTSAMAASLFAQGTVGYKPSGSVTIKFSTDGLTTLTPTKDTSSPANGVASSFGPITIDVFSAPSGTSLAGDASEPLLVAALTGAGTPWAVSSTTINAAGYIGGGEWNPATVTLANGTAGANVELEVIAFTGSLTAPSMFGFTGETFNGTQLGALGWVNGTGNPDGAPPTLPTTFVTGAGGFDGLVLTSIPEPTTMALGGLGAAALLMFRRRK
jgi:hypothetical protein